MSVTPPGPRHTAVEQADGLVIRIPTKRNVIVIVFLGVWLCGWLFGEIAALSTVLTSGIKPGRAASMMVWLGVWTVGGVFIMGAWLWQLKGCEVVTLSPSLLSIKHEILGYGWTTHYDVFEIRKFRVIPPTVSPVGTRRRTSLWGMNAGMLAFDYGCKTFRFGAGVEEAEARIILQRLKSRWPKPSAARAISA